jgi:hypothetical protein
MGSKIGVGTEEEEAATMIFENDELSKTQKEKARKARAKARVVVKHIDIIKNDFWESRPWILDGRPWKPLVVQGR